MELNVQVNRKIRELFKDDKELMDKLLKHDLDAIRKIGTYSNTGFTSEEIVNAYKTGKIDDLYKQAERKTEMRILYYHLIGEEPPKVLVKTLEK